VSGLLATFTKLMWTLRGGAAGRGVGNKHREQQEAGRLAVMPMSPPCSRCSWCVPGLL